jgi:hypothetical protein
MSIVRLKMLFGFLLLVLLTVLAAIIALGSVKQDTSHGLDQILGGLLVLAGGFAHWAFGDTKDVSLDTDRNKTA